MDIAEIRKKAQREREGRREAVRPEPPLREPAAGVVGGDDAELYDEFFPQEVSCLPVCIPSPATPVISDPLTIILEGRKAALVADILPAAATETAVEAERELEVICFRVADEVYGIDIMELKEIIKPRETTEIPHAPPFIAGVVSLRGIIIPIFVMRERLGLGAAECGTKERVIVVKRADGDGLCGILVDEVTQVVRIAAGSVEHPPAVLDGIDREFVSGIGRNEGRIIILLNLEKVLDSSLS